MNGAEGADSGMDRESLSVGDTQPQLPAQPVQQEQALTGSNGVQHVWVGVFCDHTKQKPHKMRRNRFKCR